MTYTEEKARFDELAGKYQYDAEMTREAAEARARQELAPQSAPIRADWAQMLFEWRRDHPGK